MANPSTEQQVALGNLSVDTAITSAGVVYGVYVDRVASPTQLTLFKMSATNTSEWVNTIPISAGISAEDPDPVICAGEASTFYIVCSTSGTVGTNSSAGGRDIVLIKVDASGNQIWSRQAIVSTAQADTNPYVVYSATNSCVYVSYETAVAAGNKQIVLQKYNTSGTQVWTRTIGSSLNEASSHLSLTNSGDILLSFCTEGQVGDVKTSSAYDIVVMKYNTQGTRVWTAQRAAMNSATGSNLAPVTAVDANENIFCAYTTTVGSNSGGYNIVLTKLNRAGACLWTRQEAAINTTRQEDEPSIFVDAYGYIYLSYSSYNASGISTIQVIKMNGDSGAAIWQREFHTGTMMKHLYRSELSLGADSTVYVRCLMHKDTTTEVGILKIQQSAPVTTPVLTAAPPAAPTDLSSNGTALTWSAPVGATLTGYKIYAVSNGRYVLVRSVASNVTTATIASLLPGTNDYVVTAVAATVNESEYSDAVLGVSFTNTATEPTTIVPCFLGNAPVLTPAGYRKIRSLAAGDLVVAPTGEAVPIQRVKVSRVAAGPATNPYRIAAGQFGAERSLLISPDHKVLVDGELCEAKRLGLPQEDREGVLEYYNLELADESLMVVAGVHVESLAHIRRMRMSMSDFVTGLRACYGNNITNDVIQRCVRTCRMLADGSVEVPVHANSKKA